MSSTFRTRPTSTENYKNPTHQKYVTGDGWKSGESDTDAPGAKKAKATGQEGKAGLQAETARPMGYGATGKQSMPEMKTKLGVSVVSCKMGSGAQGQIHNAGGDPNAYLGHFRNAATLKRGHNQGAPGDNLTTPNIESPGLQPPAAPRSRAVTAVSPTGQATVNMPRRGLTYTKNVENLVPRTARRAIRAGGDVGAAVAAARPVIAARVAGRENIRAARQAGTSGTVRAARQEMRQSVKAARQSPESARSERRAAKQARRGRGARVSIPGGVGAMTPSY